MAKIKKACKGAIYPKSSSVSRRLKSGGSFPDLNKDGKVTKKDILIGKGVLPKTAKKGKMVKKAQNGMTKPSVPKSVVDKLKSKGEILPYRKSEQEADKKKGFEKGTYTPPKYKNKMDSLKTEYKNAYGMKKGGTVKKTMKKGGKMTKKCAYGCK